MSGVLLAIGLCVLLTPSYSTARVITVGTSGDFETIQEAIDAASSGDIIFVSMGIYRENIHFHGKNIVLRSFNPINSTVVANTKIDGDNVDSVVTFSGTETSECVLSGFTIKNGEATYGGGISGNGASPTIAFNVISDNTAYMGAGINRCHGLIKNNIIRDNTAESDTMDDSKGGGIRDCDGTIQNNMIYNNSAEGMGGGMALCVGRIENNTIFKNSAIGHGGGMADCGGTIKNCIVWGNTALIDPQMYPTQGGSYCCVEGGSMKNGNINVNPEFVDPVGFDLHLKAISPCIDAGCRISDLTTDIDNDTRPFDGTDEPRGDGGDRDIGADEYIAPCSGLLKPDDKNLTPPFDPFQLGVLVTWEGTTQIDTFGFDLTFDSTRLSYGGVGTAGSLTSDWNSVQGNPQGSGRVRIGGFKGQGTPVQTDGTLVYVNFTVLTSDGGEFNVGVDTLVDDLENYCMGKGKMVIGAKGDVNEDGKITPADAQIVFEYYLQGQPASSHPEADVNCDSEITPADAQEILMHYLDPAREWPC